MANAQPPERLSCPRRGSTVVASLIALVVAGGVCFLGARAAANFIETSAARDLQEVLRNYDWVDLRVDGLQVFLGGTAPDEVQRFRARAMAETVVDSGRVVDDMQVAASARLAHPDFEVELLRNDDGISVIGLVPAGLNRKAMAAQLGRGLGQGKVSDLLETADYPVPQGWQDAFDFALQAARLAPHAKISVAPGNVSVRAITDSPREKVDLENALKRAKPASVALKADISAPRPAITPFTLRFVRDDKGARFDACAADTETARDRILAAGAAAGVPGKPQCVLGLGVPSPRWADAGVAGINAVRTLGAGALTISDTDVALFAPAGITDDVFDEAVGRLQAALPAGFVLTTEHAQAGDAAKGPAEFVAVVDSSGVSLRGRIANERMRDAVESLARSRFDHVDSALRSDSDVPDGWTLRAIAAIEALDGLGRGSATVTPELVRITGVSGDQMASDRASARLAQRLGAGARYELAIRYDRRRDPLLGLPSGAECVDRLNTVMRESEIGFEPNKSVIAGDPAPTLQRLAEAITDCVDFRIELGGHTDSQGSEAFNAELSRRRAQAVLKAMTDTGIDTRYMTAKGYGESQPVADNETDAGREANRRIEFILLADDPVVSEAPEPAALVQGVTDDPEAVRARTQDAAAKAASAAAPAALGAEDDTAAAAEAQPDASSAGAGSAPADDAAAGASGPDNDTAPDVLGAAIHALTDPAASALDAGMPEHGDEAEMTEADGALAGDAPADDLPETDARLVRAMTLPAMVAGRVVALSNADMALSPTDLAKALVEGALRPLPRPKP